MKSLILLLAVVLVGCGTKKSPNTDLSNLDQRLAKLEQVNRDQVDELKELRKLMVQNDLGQRITKLEQVNRGQVGELKELRKLMVQNDLGQRFGKLEKVNSGHGGGGGGRAKDDKTVVDDDPKKPVLISERGVVINIAGSNGGVLLVKISLLRQNEKDHTFPKKVANYAELLKGKTLEALEGKDMATLNKPSTKANLRMSLKVAYEKVLGPGTIKAVIISEWISQP